MGKKTLNVEVTITELKNLLMRHLDVKQSDSVADVIIGHMCQTEKGPSQLFKGLMGIFPTAEYKVGDMVWMELSYVPSWKFDIEQTKTLPNVKDNCILAQILEVNIYNANLYTISFDAIKKGESAPITDEMGARESGIIEKAENFIDILDELEKLKEDADLPF